MIVWAGLFAGLVPAAAQKIWDLRSGCLSAQGNLAPALLFAGNKMTAYADGDLEVFLSNDFAFTGACWFFIPTTGSSVPGLRVNDALFWGGNFHLLKPSRIDPFLGFTPGIGLARLVSSSSEGPKRSPFEVVPLCGVTLGCNFYVGSVFHFFVKAEGVTGQMLGGIPQAQRLDELKFMAGLGLNLRTWKPRHKKA